MGRLSLSSAFAFRSLAETERFSSLDASALTLLEDVLARAPFALFDAGEVDDRFSAGIGVVG